MGLKVKDNKDGTITVSCEDHDVVIGGGNSESERDENDPRGSPNPIISPSSGGGAHFVARKRPRIAITVRVENFEEVRELGRSLEGSDFLRLDKNSDLVLVRFIWTSNEALPLGEILDEFKGQLDEKFHYEIQMSRDE